MTRSLLLVLVLPIATSAWRGAVHPGSFHCRTGASKRPRPGWTSPFDRIASGDDRDVACMSAGSVGDASSGRGPDGGEGQEWPSDGRHSLPFVVYDAAPPPRKVGVANLPPTTGTGDTLWHGAKHYKVLRVSNHYKYEGGRFVVRRKSIEAKELKRVAKERVVARLVYGEGGGKSPQPPPPPPPPSSSA